MTMFAGRVAVSIAEIAASDWDACLPGEAENHAYFSACDGAAVASGVGLRCGAVVVTDPVGVVAVAPVFPFAYRFDTPLQGRARRWAEAAFRLVPGLAALRVLCVGSPYAERCHLGFAARLDATARAGAMEAVLAALEDEARARGAHLVAFKDLAPREDAALAPMLRRAGFASLNSLPVATLDLPFADAEGYLASLSGATRKDIRRKLAKAGAVRIEHRIGIAGLEGQIEALYEATRARSSLDYGDLEVLPPGYFAAVAEALGERAVFALYFVGDTLAAFNLLLVEPDRVIDKFLGMRDPLAREHNLYAVSWMANVRFCLERAVGELQTGQTAYASKLRFGSRLVPSTIRFRHRNRLMQCLLARLGPWLSFDHLDPQLASSRSFSSPDR